MDINENKSGRNKLNMLYNGIMVLLWVCQFVHIATKNQDIQGKPIQI